MLWTREPRADPVAMTPTVRALLLTALLAGAPTPAVALAAQADDEPAVEVEAPDAADDATSDDAGELVADDPFCPLADETSVADDAGDEAEAGDEADAADDDQGEDVEPFLDFCDEDTDDEDTPQRVSLARALEGADLGTSSFDIAVPGILVRAVTPAGKAPKALRAAPKALRAAKGVELGRARDVVAGDGPVDLPVDLGRAGRKALAGAKGTTRLTVTSTLRLASGASRSRTETVLVRRASH